MYRRRPIMRPDDTAAMSPVQLGSGSQIFDGYYMFMVGQNSPSRGLMEEKHIDRRLQRPAMIDYDFQAPLGAYGQQACGD